MAQDLHNERRLPAPLSAMICTCYTSAFAGMRTNSVIPSVLMPIPSPCTFWLNSFGVSRSGPFSLRLYVVCLRHLMSFMRVIYRCVG